MALDLLAPLLPGSQHFFALHKASGVLAANGFLTHVGLIDAAQRAQHFNFFVTDAVGAEIGRRRHGDHGQNLQQVVLDHVAHLARFIEVTPAAFDTHFFGHGNLDVVDGAVIQLFTKIELAKRSASRLSTVSLPR